MNPPGLLKALREAFLADLAEHTPALSAGLVALEQVAEGPAREELLRSLFRSAHGLKGAARASGLPAAEALCHAMESLLGAARDEGRVLAGEDVSALLAAIDALEAFARPLATAPLAEPDASALGPVRARLEACLVTSPATSPATSGPPAAPTPAPEAPPAPAPVPAPPAAAPPAAAPPAAAPPAASPPAASPSAASPPAASPAAASPPAAPGGEGGGAPPPPGPRAPPASVRLSAERLDALSASGTEVLLAAQHSEARAREADALAVELRKVRLSLRTLRPVLRRLQPRPTAGEARTHDTPATRALRAALDASERVRRLEREVLLLRSRLTSDARSLTQARGRLDAGLRELRLRPWAEAVAGLERTVRELAQAQGKEAQLVVEGAELDLDRAILEGLREPLEALVRNAVDHGLEAPAERQAAGKPPRGRVSVAARVAGGRVHVRVEDDGRGLQLERLAEAARRRGLPVPADPALALQLVFAPGVSTAPAVTVVSGRGVGLDLVAARLRAMQGTVEVASTPGLGTRFDVVLPATLSAVRALVVSLAGQLFALPALSAVRVLRLKSSEVRSAEGRAVVLHGGGPLPLVPLAGVLGLSAPGEGGGAGGAGEHSARLAVLVRCGAREAALEVDEVLAEQELVLQPLGPRLAELPFVSGASPLVGGRLVLLLAPQDVLEAALRLPGAPLPSSEAAAAAAREAPRRVLVADDSLTTRTLERTLLEGAGYEVLTAADGEEALALLRAQGADLLVSDVEMPRLDGIGLTRAVRQSKRFASLPVVLVTGLHSDADRARGLEAGASAYLVKSNFDQRVLLETVARLLYGAPLP
jgi:two-component system chemotaxis sensor kinase CheA